MLLPLVVALAGCKEKGNVGWRDTGQPQPGLPPPPWQVTAGRVAVSPDGKWALVVYSPVPGARPYAKLWDLEKGSAICELDCLTDRPNSMTFLEKGALAAVSDDSGVIHLYEIPSGKRVRTLQVCNDGPTVTYLRISADGALTGTWQHDNSWHTEIWDPATGKHLRSIAEGICAFSPDNRLALCALKPGELGVLEISSGKVLDLNCTAGAHWNGPFQFTSDSKRAFGYQRNLRYNKSYLCLFEIETGVIVWKLHGPMGFERLVAGGQQVLAMGDRGGWHTLDAASGKILRSMKVGNSRACATTTDGTMLVLATGQNNEHTPSDLTIQVWRLGRRPGLVKSWRDTTEPIKAGPISKEVSKMSVFSTWQGVASVVLVILLSLGIAIRTFRPGIWPFKTAAPTAAVAPAAPTASAMSASVEMGTRAKVSDGVHIAALIPDGKE
jgi:WD40 repeat protein